MHDALIFLADVLLLALVVVGMVLIHSQHLCRLKADEASKALQEHERRMELHKACMFDHSRHMDEHRKHLDGFSGWLALQQFKADVFNGMQAKDE